MQTKSKGPKIAIVFDNFGPYHVARLSALSKRCNLLPIQIFGSSDEYLWDSPTEISNVITLSHVRASLVSRDVINELLDKEAPDVVFVPGWYSAVGLRILRICRVRNIPVVIMSDSQEIDSTRWRIKERVKASILKHTSGMLVAGMSHRQYAEKLGFDPSDIFEKYDVVDNDHFHVSHAGVKARFYESSSYLLASCRFIQRKNLNTLFDAYELYHRNALSQGVSPRSLIVIGDGPLRGVLELKLRSMGLDDFIKMPGFVQYPELPQIYRDAFCFIHVPTSEQWGLVVNEAMAASLPVVVSDRCGCAPDLVTRSNGFIVNPEDKFDISAALDRVDKLTLGDYQRLSEASRLLISSFTPAAFADNCMLVARRAIENGPPVPSFLDRVVLGLVERYRSRQ